MSDFLSESETLPLSVGALGREAFERLREMIEAEKAGNVMAPVTVVCSSTQVANSARNQIAGMRSFLGVEFISLGHFVESLSREALADKPRLFPHLVREFGRVIAGGVSGGLLGQVAANGQAGLAAALGGVFSNLRDRSPGEIEAIGDLGGLSQEVVSLYMQYRQATELFVDRVTEFETAASLVRAGDYSRPVVGFICEPLKYFERALFEALIEQNLCRYVALGCGNFEADGELRATLPAPVPQFVYPQQSKGSLSFFGSREAANTFLVSAPDADSEVQYALSRVVEAASSGVSFENCAITFPREFPYLELVHSHGARLGVGISGRDPRRLEQSAVGRFISTFLALPRDRFAIDDVECWLASAPIRWRGESTEERVSEVPASGPVGIVEDENSQRPDLAPVAMWMRIARFARVLNADSWDLRLRQFAHVDSVVSADGDVRETQLNSQQVAALQLQRFISGVQRTFQPPQFPTSDTWQGWTTWLRTAITRYFTLVDCPVEKFAFENGCVEKVGLVLQRLANLQSGEVPVSFNSFVATVNDELRASVGRIRTPGGVVVATLDDLSGSTFDFVAVLGLSESAFQVGLNENAIVASLKTPDEATRSEANVRRFMLQLGSAKQMLLSAPRIDVASQRSVRLAPQVLNVASHIAGEFLSSDDLFERQFSWLGKVDSYSDLIYNHLLAIDPLADVLRALHQVNSDLDARTRSAVEEAQLLGVEYESQNAGTYDGVVGARVELQIDEQTKPFSASALQTWAQCPARYFFDRVLKLRENPEDEDALSFDSRDRGNVVHRVLERFLNSVRRRTSPDEPWSPEERALLFAILDEEFSFAINEGVMPGGLFAQNERRIAVRALNAFLEKDVEIRTALNTLSGGGGAEVPFGPGGTEFSITRSDNKKIALAGRIDRLDFSPDGLSAAAYDYKTGNSRATSGVEEDPVDCGRTLQGALYREIALQLLRDQNGTAAGSPEPVATGMYWHIWESGAPVNVVAAANATERLSEAVEVITEGIEAGFFPLVPSADSKKIKDNCKRCKFDSICPADRDAIAQRKSDAPAYVHFRQLEPREPDAEAADSAVNSAVSGVTRHD